MNNPLLLQHRRLFLRGLEVQARIGIHGFEQLAPQRLLIDIDLYVSLQDTQAQHDQLDEVVDYDFVRQVVQQRLAQGHIGLQETLCDDIMAALMTHPGVMAAQVSTRKPDVYPDCEAVGVEIFRAKPGVL
jgi:7,8-dihydroneopterin aldolase/epimerase/oxygenase